MSCEKDVLYKYELIGVCVVDGSTIPAFLVARSEDHAFNLLSLTLPMSIQELIKFRIITKEVFHEG